MKALLHRALITGALFLFVGCGVTPPPVNSPLTPTSPGDRYLFPIIVNHYPLFGCHPAFRAVMPIYKDQPILASNYQHLDGSPQVPHTVIKCDTCGRVIETPLLRFLSTSPCPESRTE